MTLTVDDLIARLLPSWVAFRRDLHRHPEVGFTEFRTASRIAERLIASGFTVRIGREVLDPGAIVGRPSAEEREAARLHALAEGADPVLVEQMENGLTAVVADLVRGDGPTIAMRFDIDALPVPESDEEDHLPVHAGFASMREGLMHACGHDGHATIGIAVAELAVALNLPRVGRLRLIFQPAEEGGRGARPMVEAGVVDDVDQFYALHIGCDLPSRQIATAASQMMFSTKWDVTIHGKAAHAAGNPENGSNALLSAAQAVLSLHGLPRHGKLATHVNVGTLRAGHARNVVPDTALLQIELRGEDDVAMAHMEQRGRRALLAAAEGQGCTLEIIPQGVTIGEHSMSGAKARIARAAGADPRIEAVLDEWPLGGGDDAAYFMRRVRERGGDAGYFILGSDLAAGHHASRFDFDEADLATGVRLLVNLL